MSVRTTHTVTLRWSLSYASRGLVRAHGASHDPAATGSAVTPAGRTAASGCPCRTSVGFARAVPGDKQA